jgi:hypothetical protein
MLAVPVHSDDVEKSGFKRKLITGLYGAAETEMVRKRQYLGACTSGDGDSSIARRIVHNEDGDIREHSPNVLDDVGNGAFLVETRNED